MKIIFLMGFTASGKTTIGRLLAKSLSANFIDIDEMIAKKKEMSVRSFYGKYGKKAFQEIEAELLRNCTEIRTQCSHDVLTTILCLSCGGEVCFDPNAYILFRRHGKNASSDNIGVIQKVCHDVCSFIKHKNQNRDLAREILRKLEVHLVTDARGFLDTISNYDSSWRKTCSLAFSDVLDCGFWYYNYFVRLMVLLRYY